MRAKLNCLVPALRAGTRHSPLRGARAAWVGTDGLDAYTLNLLYSWRQPDTKGQAAENSPNEHDL
jgi:hypothetical protein